MNNSDMPAMPQTFAINDAGDILGSQCYEDSVGLTKREYFAGLAMQGCCANSGGYISEGWQNSIARDAVIMADALLKELDKE